MKPPGVSKVSCRRVVVCAAAHGSSSSSIMPVMTPIIASAPYRNLPHGGWNFAAGLHTFGLSRGAGGGRGAPKSPVLASKCKARCGDSVATAAERSQGLLLHGGKGGLDRRGSV